MSYCRIAKGETIVLFTADDEESEEVALPAVTGV